MNKRDAALEQVKRMREAKLENEEIRQKLLESGLSRVQVDDLVPPPPKVEKPKVPVPDDDRRVILEATVNFLESLGSRTNQYADRYPELGSIRNECLFVGKRLRGLL